MLDSVSWNVILHSNGYKLCVGGLKKKLTTRNKNNWAYLQITKHMNLCAQGVPQSISSNFWSCIFYSLLIPLLKIVHFETIKWPSNNIDCCTHHNLSLCDRERCFEWHYCSKMSIELICTRAKNFFFSCKLHEYLENAPEESPNSCFFACFFFASHSKVQ